MPRAFVMFVQCLSHLSHFALTRRTRVTRVMQPGSASCRWPRCKTLPGTRPGPCKLRCAWPPGRKWRIRTSEHQNLWVLSTLCGNHAVTNKTSENWYENMCEFMRIPSRSTTCRPLSKYQNMAWSTRILLSTEKKKTYSCTMSLCHYVALTLPHADRGWHHQPGGPAWGPLAQLRSYRSPSQSEQTC